MPQQTGSVRHQAALPGKRGLLRPRADGQAQALTGRGTRGPDTCTSLEHLPEAAGGVWVGCRRGPGQHSLGGRGHPVRGALG